MRIADDELWNLVSGAILAVPPPLHAAEPHCEVFDPALVRRESEENKPSFVLPYARVTEHDEGGRKRYGSAEARL